MYSWHIFILRSVSFLRRRLSLIDSVIVLAAPYFVVQRPPPAPTFVPAPEPTPASTPAPRLSPFASLVALEAPPPVKACPICAQCHALRARRDPRSAVRERLASDILPCIRHTAFRSVGIRPPSIGADPSIHARRAQPRPVIPMRPVLNAVRLSPLILVAYLTIHYRKLYGPTVTMIQLSGITYKFSSPAPRTRARFEIGAQPSLVTENITPTSESSNIRIMHLSPLLSLAAALTSRLAGGAPNINVVFTDRALIEMHDSGLVVKSTNGDFRFSAYTDVELFYKIRTTSHNVRLSFAANATMINSEGPSGQSLVVEDLNGNFIFAAVAAA
ncbi:hypothetical protein DFH09DRAFT_1362384 [Mycena vulgaris]|nr:hypothetical protein DFH09DRAFT_1362384 [Mycena vulgaris]